MSTSQKIYMAVTAVLGWFALVLQLYIMLDNAEKNGIDPFMTVTNFLSFFTILSNLVVAVSLTSGLLFKNTRAGKFFLKPTTQTAIAVYIVIVGLVYSFALRKIWNPQGLQLIADRILHDVIPLVYLIYWINFIPRHALSWKDLFPWLIFPSLYFTYSIIRGAIVGWYPYPFVHAGELGYAKVLLNAVMVLLAFTTVGMILIFLNRWPGKR